MQELTGALGPGGEGGVMPCTYVRQSGQLKKGPSGHNQPSLSGNYLQSVEWLIALVTQILLRTGMD
jgi:hypothetical protein